MSQAAKWQDGASCVPPAPKNSPCGLRLVCTSPKRGLWYHIKKPRRKLTRLLRPPAASPLGLEQKAAEVCVGLVYILLPLPSLHIRCSDAQMLLNNKEEQKYSSHTFLCLHCAGVSLEA